MRGLQNTVRPHWALWLLLLAVFGTAWCGRAMGNAQGRFLFFGRPAAPDVVLPFEYFRGHIYLRLVVDGVGPRTFLLDTGFLSKKRTIVMDPASADGLRDRHGERLDIEVLGRDNLYGRKIHDVVLHLTDTVGVRSDAETLDLSLLRSALGHPLDGIIGFAFIQDYVAQIDYAGHTLTLYDPSRYRYRGHGFQVPMDRGRPVVHAIVVLPDGKERWAQFLVDTGSDSTMFLYRHFIDKNSRSLVGLPMQQATYVGLGGKYTCNVIQLRKVQLGNDLSGDTLLIDRPYVELANMGAGVSAKSKLDGLVGGLVLENSTVIFDPAQQRLIFEPLQHTVARK